MQKPRYAQAPVDLNPVWRFAKCVPLSIRKPQPGLLEQIEEELMRMANGSGHSSQNLMLGEVIAPHWRHSAARGTPAAEPCAFAIVRPHFRQ